MNVFDTIKLMNVVAQVPAFRAICNSCLARAIGAARQYIRDREATERKDEAEVGKLAVDQRNGHDEDERVGDEIDKAMGFGDKENPLLTCSKWMAVYDTALVELNTRALSKWQYAMKPEEMLRLMAGQAQGISPRIVAEIARVAKIPEKKVLELMEVKERNDRDALLKATPEILQILKSVGENGYDDSVDNIDVVDQYRLYVKVVAGLQKALDKAVSFIASSRSLRNLGDLALLEDSIEQARKATSDFEDKYRIEIGEAIEAGRNVMTLEDLDNENRLRL